MDLSEQFLQHAVALLSGGNEEVEDIVLRRAVSASYYALFHRINGVAVDLLAPNVSAPTNHRIQRWFEHAEMKKICGRFLPAELSSPLRELIGIRASADLQGLARSFIELQNARHSADYDLSYELTLKQAGNYVELALSACEAWERLKGSAEANIFILSLLLWKNWERDRL